MGSFYMNCAITRHPFCHGQEEAILIPVFMRDNKEKPVYMHDNCLIFPLFVNAKYSDCGQFEVEQSPMSDRVLALLKSIVDIREQDEDDSDEEAEFTWESFFELSHENVTCSSGRISYAAIHKKVFDRIISDYTLYGQLDTTIKKFRSDNYGYFGFEHLVKRDEKDKKNREKEANDVAADFDKRIVEMETKELAAHLSSGADVSTYTQSEDLKFLAKYLKNDAIRKVLKGNSFDSDPAFVRDVCEVEQVEGEHLNAKKVSFINMFMNGISMPWSESINAGQEHDSVGFKVLRNCYADLTVQSTIDHFEDSYGQEGEKAIDSHDEELIALMDKLQTIEVTVSSEK